MVKQDIGYFTLFFNSVMLFLDCISLGSGVSSTDFAEVSRM